MKMSSEVGEEYSSSLADLTMNSKPLINMLTILAEESIEQAAIIVQSVEKHLDQVQPEIKLPVLYLVDSIIKNVGGAYTQLFSQIIVNIFCKVFRQVDEKTRSQMFKLRETWHDVFPTIKLYQLDVKVNLIDPAWPIQARPSQTNIHVNPNFLNRASATTSTTTTPAVPTTSATVPPPATEEERMRAVVALKEQELLQLQKKKIEMELEQTRRQLQEQKKALEKSSTQQVAVSVASTIVVPPAVPPVLSKPKSVPVPTTVVPGPTPRIAPANSALVNHARRRDPRLARQQHITAPSSAVTPAAEPPMHPPHSSIVRRDPRLAKNIENEPTNPPMPVKVPPHTVSKSPNKHSSRHSHKKDRTKDTEEPIKLIRIDKLPPIPKIKTPITDEPKDLPLTSPSSPTKRKKDNCESPRSSRKHKKSKDSSPKDDVSEAKSHKIPSIVEVKKSKPKKREIEVEKEIVPIETFKEIKRRSKERNYVRRNKKSESPEADVDLRRAEAKVTTSPQPNLPLSLPVTPTTSATVPVHDTITNGTSSGDVDLRTLPAAPVMPALQPTPLIAPTISQSQRKRSPPEQPQHEPNKKSKSEKLDALFGDEDVDLRTLPRVTVPLPTVDALNIIPSVETLRNLSPVGTMTPPPPPIVINLDEEPEKVEQLDESEESSLGNIKDVEGGWAKVKEIQSPQVAPSITNTPLSNFDVVRAKLVEATRGKDRLGRPRLFSSPSDEGKDKKKSRNSEDTDMRLKTVSELDGNSLDDNIKIIMSQADEQLKSGNINKDQYNILLMQILQLNERQKLKEAKQNESLEASKRKLHWLQQKNKQKDSVINKDDRERSETPESDRSNDSPQPPLNNNLSLFGDIDERIVPPMMGLPINNLPMTDDTIGPQLLRPDFLDLDMRQHNQVPSRDRLDMGYPPSGSDPRFALRPPVGNAPRGIPPRGWRGPRPRAEEWNGPRGFRPRGPPANSSWRGASRPPLLDHTDNRRPPQPFIPLEPLKGNKQGVCPLMPYKNEGRTSPPLLGMHSSKDGLPVMDHQVIEYIDRDTMKTIFIDGVPREIRYYGATAVIMLDWDDPREISFQPGKRRISFDDDTFVLGLNEDFISITIDGQMHMIRFGAPTRELFIDDMWFECFFGGPPVPILIDNKVKSLKMEGPPPQVNIGKEKRTDLCAGKINVIIDATTMVPVFLDAKPQRFQIEGVTHTLRFVDSLQTILINEKPYKVEFGGLPKPIYVNRRKHFIRFSVLPRSVKAGCVEIQNMEGKKPEKTNADLVPALPVQPISLLPSLPEKKPLESQDIEKTDTGVSKGLDMLASIMPSSLAPASQSSNYSLAATAAPSQPEGAALPTNLSSVLPTLDVSDLYAKLVATGLLQTTTTTVKPAENNDSYSTNQKREDKQPEEKPTKTANFIKQVDLLKSDTLKVKQVGLVGTLYSGMQCGSCGARFPPEHTVRYSQHLDWHFRQNRAERDSQRRPHSRRWYYDIPDWVQFEEIEDLEEREKSWFERQQEEGAALEATESSAANTAAMEEVSVSAPPPSAPPHQLRCSHCGDAFDQFYNQDLEEWQLRRAVTFQEKNYHPICLEEYKTSTAEKEAAADTSGADDTLVSDKETEHTDSKPEEPEEGQETMEESLEPEEVETIDNQEESDKDESVVEVLSEHSQEEEEEVEVVEEEVLDEDDDVVIKAEPVVQIVVDDVDTDEETEKERAARDEAYEIDFSKIKIKQEPIDPDDEPVIMSEELITAHADTTHAAVVSSIDGNVQLQPTMQTNTGTAKIRINITKPLPAHNTPPPPPPEVLDQQEDSHQGDGIQQEEIVYKLKPSLEGVEFTKHPPVNRGQELSALCAIM